MSVPIQPMEDYIVAVAEEAKTKSAGGILLPDSAKEKPATVKVVAVGKDVDGIKVGDSVIYKNTYEATEIKVGTEQFVIVYKKNIIATVKG